MGTSSKKRTLGTGNHSSQKSRPESGNPNLHSQIQMSQQKKVELFEMPNRPLSGKPDADSGLSSEKMDVVNKITLDKGERSEDIDSFDSSEDSSLGEDISEETYYKSESDGESVVMSSESSEEEDLGDQAIRVYDARFKIPAQSNLGQLMSAKNSTELTRVQSNKQYRQQVKRLERFKKFVSSTAIILMGGAMIFNIVIYGMLINDLQKDTYYLERTRYNVTKTIDFEELRVSEIKYFLYKNLTEGAQDASSSLDSFIVGDVDILCQNEGVFLESDPDKLTSVRDNINSAFMLASEAYILLLMTIMMIFVTIIIP